MHLVDQVEQDRAAAGLASPRAVVKVVVRFVKQGAALHRHHAAQLPAGQHRTGLRHDGAVRPVVAHQHPRGLAGVCLLGLHGGEQPLAVGHRGGHRFFQQHRQARVQTQKGLLHMQGIGRGQHHRVDVAALQHLVQCLQAHNTLFSRPFL